MAMAASRVRRAITSGVMLASVLLVLVSAAAQPPKASPPRLPARTESAEALDTRPPDFVRLRLEQEETDRAWRKASQGFMRMEKITYRSRAGDLDIPAFVFQPLESRPTRSAPALVWVHENIRGHLYEHYVPYIREATSRGYVVIAPEYRGSIGYGKAFYDAIDYGGAEVDDVIGAATALSLRYAEVDRGRIGIVGWSHGGLIALLAIFRSPTTFKAGAAIVPVSNLFQRISWKGDRQRRAMDPQNRFGGPPSERHDLYRDRSPLYQVDKLKIPLLVHIAENDEDVNIEEALPLVDALRARKPALAETKVYTKPPGGHLFDRLVNESTWQPKNSEEQRDSWSRLWAFFERQLTPIRTTDATPASVR
jgi:dipeptidyl aminopeptidase/acylaminoacyl peptidase